MAIILDADVQAKLACKICELAYSIALEAKYGLECTNADLLDKLYEYYRITTYACPISYSLQCEIIDYVQSLPQPTPFDSFSSITCSFTISDTSPQSQLCNGTFTIKEI